MNGQEIVSLVSLLVALVAVIVGPITTVWMVRRQIVIPIRQSWIEELRSKLSTFISLSDTLAYENRSGVKRSADDFVAFAERLGSVFYQIVLRLNPNEEEHSHLAENLELLRGQAFNSKSDAAFTEYRATRERLVTLSREILKREWEKVKELRQ